MPEPCGGKDTACPGCGLENTRIVDGVCQWCGWVESSDQKDAERWCDFCDVSSFERPLTFGHGGFLALCAVCVDATPESELESSDQKDST